MSDYLTRLIERSLGAPPQIEPLIAPLYAPSEQILSERSETIATSVSAPVKTESSEREAKPGDPGKSRTEAAFSRSKRQGLGEAPPFPKAPPRFPVEKRDERSDSQPRPPFHELSATPAPEILEPTSVPFSPPMVSQEGTRVVVEPKIIARPGSGGAPEEPPPLPNGKSRTAVQPEIIVHRNSPKAAAVPAPPSANEPPAIHVTIGRVEVRAVMSPSAPPKVASRAAPKLSLEDYLKQRNRTSR